MYTIVDKHNANFNSSQRVLKFTGKFYLCECCSELVDNLVCYLLKFNLWRRPFAIKVWHWVCFEPQTFS